jgi:hypothetical protein
MESDRSTERRFFINRSPIDNFFKQNPWYNWDMPKPHKPEIPDIRVADGAAAFHKLEDFTRRIFAVPKKEIDAAISKEHKKKSATPKQRR